MCVNESVQASYRVKCISAGMQRMEEELLRAAAAAAAAVAGRCIGKEGNGGRKLSRCIASEIHSRESVRGIDKS